MQTQIRLENINKSYGKHKILDNLNISIFPEDFITILVQVDLENQPY